MRTACVEGRRDFALFLGHHRPMSRIEVPARATVTESYQLIRTCTALEQAPDGATLDCTQVERFGPFGIALLASSFALRRVDEKSTDLVLDVDSASAEFIREVGLDRFARGERTGLGTLEVRQMMALDAV